MNFRISLSFSIRTACWDFGWNAVESVNQCQGGGCLDTSGIRSLKNTEHKPSPCTEGFASCSSLSDGFSVVKVCRGRGFTFARDHANS